MDTQVARTLDLIDKFNQAFNRQDLEGVMALMTEDCVFENTNPAPDGTRHAGQRAVRAAFADFFGSSPNAEFTAEEVFATADRCVVRWIYRWNANTDRQGHVRGVDVFHVRDGKVAEKLSYVKG